MKNKLLIALLLLYTLLLLTKVSYADHQLFLQLDDENNESLDNNDAILDNEYFFNNLGVLVTSEQIRQAKDKYISAYRYFQNPFVLTLGGDNVAGPDGTFIGGLGNAIVSTAPLAVGSNRFANISTAQIWGQTGRLGGFALGGTAFVVNNFSSLPNQANNFSNYKATTIITPSQAYIDYLYGNNFEIALGSIVISTPWVTSYSAIPGSSIGNGTFQGAMFNIQLAQSLLLTGFTAYSYSQYPFYNTWFNQQNLYNYFGGPLSNLGTQSGYGPSGIGFTWNPIPQYSGKFWLYNFDNYAQLAYNDNNYHINVKDPFSIDINFQDFAQRSFTPSFVNQINLPGQSTTAGGIVSNGLGALIGFNTYDNSTTFAFNTIFGPNGSFLNGGMVTPYTYGLEVDPLYTTPALFSIAELGSGYAYSIRNTTFFLKHSLRLSVIYTNFVVNQLYATQPNQVSEYDTALVYKIPQTTLSLWGRVSYIQQPSYAGGDYFNSRLSFNWLF
jgi:hypothetical protein